MRIARLCTLLDVGQGRAVLEIRPVAASMKGALRPAALEADRTFELEPLPARPSVAVAARAKAQRTLWETEGGRSS